MTRGHYIRGKVRRNNYHLAFKKEFLLDVSWFAVGPSRFPIFSFSVLMPVHCGKPNRVCFLYISIWMAPKMQLSQFSV